MICSQNLMNRGEKMIETLPCFALGDLIPFTSAFDDFASDCMHMCVFTALNSAASNTNNHITSTSASASEPTA